MKRILVTGGAGFIGSNFIRWMLAHEEKVEIVNLDKLTYAGNLENLKEVQSHPYYRFVQGDVADSHAVKSALKDCRAIIHFAAETHVDRSIVDASDFLRTNVLGTAALLEAARQSQIERFILISTDEVYGSLLEGAADEQSILHPNSPYAASKASADLLTQAYQMTYGLPILILRASNNFGPYQFPEKFIPLMVTNALEGQPLPIYGDGLYTREWLFVEDFCEAIHFLFKRGELGQIYNVGSGHYRLNLEIAEGILKMLGKPLTLIHHVTNRLGHDRRYAIVSSKIHALGWTPRHSFDEALKMTIRWYQEHSDWWLPLREKAASLKKGVAAPSL